MKFFKKQIKEKDVTTSSTRDKFYIKKCKFLYPITTKICPLFSILDKKYIDDINVSDYTADVNENIKDNSHPQGSCMKGGDIIRKEYYNNISQIFKNYVRFGFSHENTIGKEMRDVSSVIKKYNIELTRHYNSIEYAMWFGAKYRNYNKETGRIHTKMNGIFNVNMATRIEIKKISELYPMNGYHDNVFYFFGKNILPRVKNTNIASHHPLFDMNGKEDYIVSLDIGNITFDFLNNRDTFLKTNIQPPDLDGRIDEYLTEGTLNIKFPNRIIIAKLKK